MTTIDYNDAPASGRRTRPLLARLAAAFANWRSQSRRRRAMSDIAALNAHLLRDIGLNSDDIDRGVPDKHRAIWLNPMTDDDK